MLEIWFLFISVAFIFLMFVIFFIYLVFYIWFENKITCKTYDSIIIETSGDEDKFSERTKAIIKVSKDRKYKNVKFIIYSAKRLPPEIIKNKKIEKHLFGSEKLSIIKAINRFKNESNAVFFSAGDTKEIVIRMKVAIGTMHRKLRPILANTMPKLDGFICYGDLGANILINKNDINNWTWIALLLKTMAISLYKKAIIGLQNIGEEPGKGGAAKEKIRNHLKKVFNNAFIGNVEPHQMFFSEINTLITDGETGNNSIKMYAGTINFLYKSTKNIFLSFIAILLFKILYLLCWKRLDWRNYDGAMLLGLKSGKAAFIAHGRTDFMGCTSGLERALNPKFKEIFETIDTSKEINKFIKEITNQKTVP